MKILRTALGRLKLLLLLVAVCTAGPRVLAVTVDAELVLVVDITGSLSDDDFTLLMDGLAASFESSGLMDAIQSGTTGRLAASLVFYSNRNSQAIGVDWMEISDANSAAAFAQAVSAAARPFDHNPTGVAGAIDFAGSHFGSETGSPGNGFESANQGVYFIGDGVDDHSKRTNGSREETVQNSRDGALSSGVEVISALTIGAPGTVDDYFGQNVIGGQAGPYSGRVTNAADVGQAIPLLQPELEEFVDALTPEPQLPILLALGTVPLLMRRRGDSLRS